MKLYPDCLLIIRRLSTIPDEYARFSSPMRSPSTPFLLLSNFESPSRWVKRMRQSFLDTEPLFISIRLKQRLYMSDKKEHPVLYFAKAYGRFRHLKSIQRRDEYSCIFINFQHHPTVPSVFIFFKCRTVQGSLCNLVGYLGVFKLVFLQIYLILALLLGCGIIWNRRLYRDCFI